MKYHIIIVGVGGTGTYVIKELARFLSTSPLKRDVMITLIDGDVVEQRNLERQCFLEEDVGENKALAMGFAIQESFNVNCSVIQDYIKKYSQLKNIDISYGFLPVVISCVDNNNARLLLEEYFEEKRSIVYIDSGNGFSNGQCIYAVKADGKIISPSRKFYGFRYEDEKQNYSCEEWNRIEPQHLLTNMQAAQHILRAIIPLVQTGTAPRGICFWDAFSGNSSHEFPEKYGFNL